ncbi:MAG: 50S ribosomal protein L23 [Candidatus Diapherotrites archaeon]|jgi:large subunit ribosomal protein L23|uniref:Large ribosomal subunit protein uL23 n=1 Tax=Candidatus Iainarchaeum sp. TaxID=3101447 RepID=A0A8T5GF43_9ARCH|nr:50S ribosomal protein L23 [Candidatus Diapherotrites archaeon]MBT7241610.1 50S ribosomal protein L23 [Candidatus Diapherotrites archaeon]
MVKLNEDEKRQAKQETEAKHEAEKVVEEVKPIKTNATLEDLEIVFFPLVTEKSVNMIEAENKLTFIVADSANKQDVKRVIQKAYEVKVEKVNIIRDRKGRKKAIVKLGKENKAQDLATKLGVL